MILRALKRVVFSLAVTGITLYGIGGCGLRQIGAGMLSNFLTGGDLGSLGSSITSELDTLLNQLTGGTT